MKSPIPLQFPVLLPMLLVALSAPAQSAPDIKVGAMYEYVAPGKSAVLKRIRNVGDSTAFVKVTVTEIIYDAATGAALEQPAAAIVADRTTRHDTLISSPARLIVPAGGMQATRLLALGPRLEERYFRVRFVPVLPEKPNEFSLDEAQAADYRETLSAGVTMLTGYGIIAIVRPRTVRYDTQLQDAPDHYTVRNNGNGTVVLENYAACDKKDVNCSNPLKIHVRPGKAHTFDKQAGQRHRFDLIEGDRKKSVGFMS